MCHFDPRGASLHFGVNFFPYSAIYYKVFMGWDKLLIYSNTLMELSTMRCNITALHIPTNKVILFTYENCNGPVEALKLYFADRDALNEADDYYVITVTGLLD